MLAINEVVSVGACRTPIDFPGPPKLLCANELSVITVVEAIQPDDRVIWEDFGPGIDRDKTNYNSAGIALGPWRDALPLGSIYYRLVRHQFYGWEAPLCVGGGQPWTRDI